MMRGARSSARDAGDANAGRARAAPRVSRGVTTSSHHQSSKTSVESRDAWSRLRLAMNLFIFDSVIEYLYTVCVVHD